jgi:hypothetical protein
MSVSQSQFKERFSLGWLAPSDEQSSVNPPSSSRAPASSSAAAPLPPGIEAVLNSVGSQVLLNLKAQPEQQSTLLKLASATSLRFEALLPVMQYLGGKGYVERAIEDPTGNDTYKITTAGLNPPVTLL